MAQGIRPAGRGDQLGSVVGGRRRPGLGGQCSRHDQCRRRHRALDSLLAADRIRTGVARLRADRALVAFPEIRSISYFTQVVEELDSAGDLGDWGGPDALADSTRARRGAR